MINSGHKSILNTNPIYSGAKVVELLKKRIVTHVKLLLNTAQLVGKINLAKKKIVEQQLLLPTFGH